MKQRVKLAQAIVHDPGLLCLDEPTVGMDPQGRDDMLEIRSSGSTGARHLADRLIALLKTSNASATTS